MGCIGEDGQFIWESWINGVRYRRRIGDVPWKIALDISRKMRIEIIEGNFNYGRKAKDLTFDDARAKFEAWAETNKKPLSAHSYREALRRLSETFAGKLSSEISPFSIESHRQARIKKGVRVRVNRELAVLKNLFNRVREWACMRAITPWPP